MATSKRAKNSGEGRVDGNDDSRGSGGAMRLVTLLLALAGAVFGSLAFFRPRSAGAPAEGKEALDARFATEARSVRSEVQSDFDRAVAKVKESVATEGKRVSEARDQARAMKDAIEGQSEAAAQAFAKRTEVLDARIDDVARDSTSTKESITALDVAIRDLKARPVAVASAPRDPAPVVKPSPTAPVKPATPDAPVAPVIDKEKVRTLIADLAAPDLGKVFTACSKLGGIGDLDAVEPLAKVAREHKDPLIRSSALSALGKLHSCDGMATILASMADKDGSVALVAGQAFTAISGLDSGLTGDATRKEKNEARDKWAKWWKDHEAEMRAKWNQPVAGAPGARPASGRGAVRCAPGGQVIRRLPIPVV